MIRATTLAAAVFLLGGCAAVRPVTLRPSLPAPAAYTTDFQATGAPAPATTGRTAGRPGAPPGLLAAEEESTPDEDAAETPEGGAGVPVREGERWWTAFADPALDSVILETLRHNYVIRDLRNLIYENQLDPLMPKGPLWPLQIGIPGTVQRSTITGPPAGGSSPYDTTFYEADLGLAAT